MAKPIMTIKLVKRIKNGKAVWVIVIGILVLAISVINFFPIKETFQAIIK